MKVLLAPIKKRDDQTVLACSWYEEAEIFPCAWEIFPSVYCLASGASRINYVIRMAVSIINVAQEETEQTVIHKGQPRPSSDHTMASSSRRENFRNVVGQSTADRQQRSWGFLRAEATRKFQNLCSCPQTRPAVVTREAFRQRGGGWASKKLSPQMMGVEGQVLLRRPHVPGEKCDSAVDWLEK